MSLPAPSKSAFCKARLKLQVLFFENFFAHFVTCFYRWAPIKRYKGFRLWACDGSAIKLPDNADTRSIGTHTNQHGTCASVKLLCYYDLLNCILTRFWLKNKRVQELYSLKEHIGEIPQDVLSIYDRHYGSHLLLFLHQHFGSHCLIRLRVDFSNTVKAFLSSGQAQSIICEHLNEHAWVELRKMGYKKSKYHLITYQLIRVELSSGESEVLMSSLLTEDFTVADFADLYRQRWGIETCFDYLKNIFKAPVFSGYSTQACSQDLFSVAIMFNMQTLLIASAAPAMTSKCDKRKASYQINRNVSLESLKRNLPAIFTAGLSLLKATLAFLLSRFLQSLERVRLYRSKPRKEKILRANNRHQTEYSYKPAI